MSLQLHSAGPELLAVRDRDANLYSKTHRFMI